MKHSLPEDAFTFYARLGPARSYQAVADEFGVHKRTVVRTADRDNWTGRLAEIEKRAQREVDDQLAAELRERKLRQRKLVIAIASRAAKAINDFPLRNGIEGIRAAELAIKLERLLDGEATENTTLDIEQLTRRECQELLQVVEVDGKEEEGGENEGPCAGGEGADT